MRTIVTALATTALVGLAAGTASAQAVSCGGIGDAGEWMGGSPETSDLSISDGPLVFFGLPVAAGGSSVTLFSLSAPGDVRLEAQPFPGGDSVIELYDATGTLLVTDDDSGGSLASRAEVFLDAGEYCLLTRGWAGNGLDADISVGRLEHEAITAGLSGGFFGGNGDPFFVGVDPCTAETPATIIGTGALDAILGEGGASAVNSITGVPYYRFTLDSPQAVSITAENESADPYIYIFDASGNLLAENDDFQSLNSRIDFTTPLEAGSYCIGMRALSNPDVPVTVTVSGYDAAAALRELYDIGNAAPPLDGSYPITDLGELAPRTVQDIQLSGETAAWFAFEVSEGGLIQIDAVEVVNSDPILILFDVLGNEIAYNDDANGTLNSQILVRVQAGQYLLAVRQYSDFYSGTIRVATERFVPASQ